MNSRRKFLKLAGTGMVAAGLVPLLEWPQKVTQGDYVYRKADRFKLGIAGYTFYKVTIEKAIGIMKKVNVLNLSLKDNFLPMNSDKATIEIVTARFRNAGINVYTVGVIYMAKPGEVDRAFQYAREAGVGMIVAAPNIDMLPLVEKKVKEYDMRVAIHNHGPDNPLFPTATDIWEQIKSLDNRIGICLDIGHTVRSGHDPVKDMISYGSRIYDMHIKDVTAASKEGKTIEMGRGIIDIKGFIAAMRQVRYSGMCSLEFEKDMADPTAGIVESIEYFRKILSEGRPGT